MFSYVFMKILEMRPQSYDRLIERVSKGRMREIKEAVADEIPNSGHVLEIGCGTGELSEMMIKKGVTVYGFDINPNMIAVAENRIASSDLEGKMTVAQMGVDGMDSLPDEAFDAVVSTLVFSELSDDERRFALKHAKRALKQGGRLILADEVIPQQLWRKCLYQLIRIPMVAATYLVSRSTTRPIPDLAKEIDAAGFIVEKERRTHGGTFAMVVAVNSN